LIIKTKPVILVVDDHPQGLELIEAYLVPQGYEIITAANGEEALIKLAGNQIDLILLDVLMPGMNGFELTRKVRQNEKYRLLPIILITALRGPKDRVKGIEAGCDDFISKPFDEMELLARVQSLLKVKAYNDLMSNYQIELKSEVTERTKELKHAFLFQQRLIDALPIPVFYMDSEDRYLGCNSSFENFIGQKREHVTGKSLFEIFPKEIAGIFHEKNLALLQNPGIQIYETTVKNKSGAVHNVILHKATFPNMDGSVGGLIGAILDITEHKRAEDALRERDIQLKKLTSLVPGMIYQITKRPDGTNFVPFTTEAIQDIFGCSPQDVRDDFSPIARVILPDDFDKVVDSIEYSAQNLTVWTCEYRVQIPGQSIKWISGIASPEKLADGSITWYGFNSDATNRKKVEEELKQTLESLRKAMNTTIQVMVSAIETRDPYTAGHQLRVADLARAIAAEMGLSKEKIDGIRMAGSIHDIGKISIPAEILSKPIKLTDIEFSLIKEHSRSGYEILKDVESPWPLAQIIYQHHERMDGSGYPRNMKGHDILIEARIIAVADVVEAMASHRPYRPGLGIVSALNEIEKNRGISFDQAAVDACLKLFREKGFKLEGA
jgi:PAS domain S-box-containing protein/putative nucleotidyltransferase with HDIG domain